MQNLGYKNVYLSMQFFGERVENRAQADKKDLISGRTRMIPNVGIFMRELECMVFKFLDRVYL